MRWRLIGLACLVMTGCTGGNYAPVYDYSRNSPDSGKKVVRGVHVVRGGETLYSIAWRYGWDYRSLARANDIAPPYTIHPGDRIDLGANDPGAARKNADTGSASRRASAPKPSSSQQHSSAPEKTPRTSSKKTAPAGPLSWQWPAEGKLVSRFSATDVGQKGIAIAGNEGAPVRAAARGVVVYRGNGLTGYGNLLIIKHSDRWLSAYAHNREMLVREGAEVSAGEKVASMGASGTFRTQLHFEIRRDGEPVDPLPLLPER